MHRLHQHWNLHLHPHHHHQYLSTEGFKIMALTTENGKLANSTWINRNMAFVVSFGIVEAMKFM